MRAFFSIFFTAFFFLFSSAHVFSHTTTITVVMTKDGFLPQETTIDKDSTVVFVNNDVVNRWPASNIHPTHGIYPEFDPLRPIKPGDSWSFVFDKTGQWKYHDHLLPHIRGTIFVEKEAGDSISDETAKNKEKKQKIISYASNVIEKIKQEIRIFFIKISSLESTLKSINSLDEKEQLVLFDDVVKAQGAEKTWNYIVNTYSKKTSELKNAHSIAHYLGGILYEEKGLDGLSICDESFAFGCYHGFADNAFAKDISRINQMEQACEKVGQINSDPWSSCVHGIGHGVATFFQDKKLRDALLTCATLKLGDAYCYDGVFMEFSTGARKEFYVDTNSGPLFPCNSIDSPYRQACARSQPRVMSTYFRMTQEEIVKTCLLSDDEKIRYYCIDAIGQSIAQNAKGNTNVIERDCNKISSRSVLAQCLSAAAEEIIFQKYKDWESTPRIICARVADEFKQTCNTRIAKVFSNYPQKN